MIRQYTKEIVNTVNEIDLKWGTKFVDALLAIKDNNITAEVAKSYFESIYANVITNGVDESVLSPIKERLFSCLLDYADLCTSFYKADENLVNWYKTSHESTTLSTKYYNFHNKSFIFEFKDELYRCYDKDHKAVIECIGIGSHSASATYRTSIRNIENDIMCELSRVNCPNTTCPRQEANDCSCTMFDAMRCGQFDSVSPLDIVVVAKAIMCKYNTK